KCRGMPPNRHCEEKPMFRRGNPSCALATAVSCKWIATGTLYLRDDDQSDAACPKTVMASKA
ncbi:MAG: hypothetical protein V6Z78_04170, partial [Holosporaceae bacterium]